MAETQTYESEEETEAPVLSADDIAKQRKLARRWHRKISQSEKFFERRYWEKVKKIIKRYRDEREDMGANSTKRFNMLWSNIEVLKPAVASKEPKPYVTRRWQDKDPIARVASTVLERCVGFQMEATRFMDAFKQGRDDYLLAGRGLSWQRYEGKMVTVPPEVDPATGVPAVDPATGQPVQAQQQLKDEKAPLDYVNWRDFLHDPKPIWKEVRWVARIVLITKEEAEKQDFDPEAITRMSFTHRRMDDEKDHRGGTSKRDQEADCAKIYEIWDMDSMTVIWLSKDIEDKVLKQLDDFMEFADFFPCPPPLFATMTTDTLIPRPDYTMYQDQAQEIDTLTLRIELLTKALAVRGAYDASAPALKGLLKETPENFLVPVENWAAFSEKGGFVNAISFVPIDMVIKVIGELIAKRALLIQDVYQITGISDIVRGQTQPHETATAQSIKGNFATLRLEDRRGAVASFARDGLRLMSEVIAEHFEPETIRRQSGFDYITEIETMREMHGDEAVEMLWNEVMALFRDGQKRAFQLDIETDSTIQMDRSEEQQRRTEFLGAVSGFIKEAGPIMAEQPMLAPLMGQMLLFGVRGFSVGRELESEVESLVAQVTAQASQPAPPETDPEAEAAAAKSQAEIASIQASTQAEGARTQQEMVQSDQKHKLDMKHSQEKQKQETLNNKQKLKMQLLSAKAAAAAKKYKSSGANK